MQTMRAIKDVLFLLTDLGFVALSVYHLYNGNILAGIGWGIIACIAIVLSVRYFKGE